MRFASFDFFRKINTDVGETSSALGGLLTILAFTVLQPPILARHHPHYE